MPSVIPSSELDLALVANSGYFQRPTPHSGSTSWIYTIRSFQRLTFPELTNVTGELGGLPEYLNQFCPDIKTVAEARRFGVSFVLEAKGAAGPSGAIFVRANWSGRAVSDS